METRLQRATLPYRLAASDLDGTLLGPNKEISPENFEAVERLRGAGLQIILASGRRHQNSIQFQRQLGLKGPIVACQGGLIRDGETGDVLEAHFIPPALVREIVRIGTGTGVQVIYYHLDHLYGGAAHDRWLDLYESRVGEKPEVLPSLEQLNGQRALKLVWYGDPNVLHPLRPKLESQFAGEVDILSTENENLEFMPPGINKATALAKVILKLGIDAREVITFGDGENDVAMLRWAGLGVAMNHGSRSAKAAAKLVSPPGPPETAFARAVDEIFAQNRK
ncbi:MAG: HAD family phosphatase [Verrucomicrobia bacterium]|nr:HAD family phosphatase [Verrucomicrobiota bacterium]